MSPVLTNLLNNIDDVLQVLILKTHFGFGFFSFLCVTTCHDDFGTSPGKIESSFITDSSVAPRDHGGLPNQFYIAFNKAFNDLCLC